jgi:hypothetical protein
MNKTTLSNLYIKIQRSGVIPFTLGLTIGVIFFSPEPMSDAIVTGVAGGAWFGIKSLVS